MYRLFGFFIGAANVALMSWLLFFVQERAPDGTLVPIGLEERLFFGFILLLAAFAAVEAVFDGLGRYARRPARR